jgi:DNA-binding transcriptional LysR family regulator
MELRQLRHLIAVVEHGSFSRAAEAVHLTQPALSRSIQALEASVGAPVLERHRGAIEPTDVGRLLLTHARQLDSATRDLERDIALTQGLELGELRIGVGPYGGSALVGPALGRLNLAHPGLRLKTVLAPWQELPDRARARDVDLIVVELSQVQLMDDFAVQALSEHGLVVVCQPRHPLTGMDSPSPGRRFSATRWPGPASPRRRPALLQNLPPRQRARPAAKAAACWRWSATCRACSRTCCGNSHAISLMPAFMVARGSGRGPAGVPARRGAGSARALRLRLAQGAHAVAGGGALHGAADRLRPQPGDPGGASLCLEGLRFQQIRPSPASEGHSPLLIVKR